MMTELLFFDDYPSKEKQNVILNKIKPQRNSFGVQNHQSNLSGELLNNLTCF